MRMTSSPPCFACRPLLGVACALLAFSPAWAEDADDAALQLADSATPTVEQASNLKAFGEAAYGNDRLRDGSLRHNRRLSLDLQYEHAFAPDWRGVFADRLDMNWPAQAGRQRGINIIKEAYVSWQAKSELMVDAGRINARNGVATGYSPTDYFRDNAVRSQVSIDPASLKVNRQGSVMLRGQTLWDGGSATAIYSPKLGDMPHNGDFNPDFGATNHQDRWLIAASQKVSDNLRPQLLLYKEANLPVQLGFNLTGLLNDATVAYVEWSGGRSPSLLARALQRQGLAYADDSRYRNRLSTGLTFTTSNKLSVTAEWQYNGGSEDRAGWDSLRRAPLPVYGLYRSALQVAQESPTRQRLFLYGAWQDALLNHLDLSAMSYYDMQDYSRLSWLEARYHWERNEVAVQWQRYSGQARSDFGATELEGGWQLLLRRYF